MTTPFLSVVIANFNYGRFLCEALDSLVSQSCQDFEVIVVDGGSSDNSVDIIRSYACGLPANISRKDFVSPACTGNGMRNDTISWWTSERDDGQSDAFNKGFAHATGLFLTWLNADDVMLPGTIAKLKEAHRRHPSQEWFTGGCFWLDEEMNIMQCRRAQRLSSIEARTGHVGVWGPSSFFTKRMLEKAGGVDVRFKFAMDNDLWHKFYYREGLTYEVFTDYAWGLRLHANGKMSGQNFDARQADPNHPRWEQLRRERIWQEEIYRPEVKMTLFRRIMSISWPKAIASRVDSFRYRGKHYLEYFK